MAKRKNNKKANKKSNKNNSGDGITSMVRTVSRVPVPINKPFKIRRSWNQDIMYYGTQGWFNSGSQDFQVNFGAYQSTINIGGSLVFGPSTSNATEISGLFDQYRITMVTLRIDWDYNAYPQTTGAIIAPLIHYVADYDDSGSCPLTSILQYPGVQTHSFMENGYSPLIVTVKPKPLRDVAGSGVLTSYGPMPAPWIRTAEMSTPHYGLKFCSTNYSLTSTAFAGTISLTCYIDMELANPK